MSSISSFISSYRPQLKGKVAIKSPFTKRSKLDGPSTSTPPPNGHPSIPPEEPVIEIGDFGGRRSESLDFYDSAPASLNSPERPVYTDSTPPRLSTRLQLQLDLSPDTEPLSDWFSTSFPRAEVSPEASKEKAQNGEKRLESAIQEESEEDDELLTEGEALREGMKHISHQDVLASLEALEASDFGMLSKDMLPYHSQPSPLKIPEDRTSEPDDDFGFNGVSRPMSGLSSPLSSAISGTTLARQLMANTYVLSSDNRRSRYRSFGGGLTRSDSTTLPRGERGGMIDYFEVDPEAPPIPTNAEELYIAPKTPRTPLPPTDSAKPLRRRGSTGSIATRLDQAPISPPTRPTSVVLSPSDIIPPIPLQSQQQRQQSSAPSDSQEVNRNNQDRKHIPPAIDVEAPVAQPQPSPRPLSQTSPSGSEQASPRHLEDVLDYYSFSENPPGGTGYAGFRPVFTPITEESMSQLSPPTPYRNERRDSHRSQLIGARSPLSKNSSRKRSLPTTSSSTSSSPLPTIHDRPHSVQFSVSSIASSPNHRSTVSLSSVESTELLPPPPPLTTIFAGRQRSGSAPSPIKVVRDPNDRNKYTIAVGDNTDSSLSSPTTAGSGVDAQQTFPESAVSNGWSAVVASPGPTAPDSGVMPMPDVPQSAALPSLVNGQPTLAQQLLLTRAQTTRHDRHSRKGSFSGVLPKRSESPLSTQKIPEEENPEADISGSTIVVPRDTTREHPPPLHPPPKRSLPPSPMVDSHANTVSTRSTSSQERLFPPSTPIMMQHNPSGASVNRSASISSARDGSDAVSVQTEASTESARMRIKSLPPLPPSSPPSNTSSTSGSPAPGARVPRPRVPPSLQLTSNSLTAQMSEMVVPTTGTSTSSSNGEPESRPPPSIPQVQLHGLRESTNTIDAILQASTSYASPPPYYSVVDVGGQQSNQPNGSTNNPPGFPAPLKLIPSSTQMSMMSDSPLTGNPRDSAFPGGRSRLRPPGPAGPRRPTGLQQSISSPIVGSSTGTSNIRERSGSQASLSTLSSLQSSTRHNSTRRVASSSTAPVAPVSPRFQPPAVKWKGYTLEVAKWTFSSAQLQEIVSRAIRDSALSSSIRLLKLESVNDEIPDELHRLEMLRTDIKAKYKALTRRRTGLFEALTLHVTGATGLGEAGSPFAMKITEELKELSLRLDALAEELHTTDEQIAQLNSLLQVHSASALSVALRKLNGSLMKQKEENDFLRQQNIALEQERDEAWVQAQQLADEYDSNFSDKDASSRRSSRVSARRKSSVRLSRAGLRSGSRRQSARSSVASSAYGGLPYLQPTPVTSRHDVPPMPPLPDFPRRRPDVLTIYEPPLRSSGALSANDMTPDSETREMVQVQEELYSMLGITSPLSARLKRSHSMLSGLPSAGLSPPPMSARFAQSSFRQRRSSLPGGAALVEAHHARDADHHAVLATFATLPAEL
ncbi:hypothetical protein CC2G_014988 [Coprinopsis cinerea AmutBmut pab1-1]|nr:hypothetical protein CC2G_014988 [Coprinopsis cinerea AmutBmut pab1-1]